MMNYPYSLSASDESADTSATTETIIQPIKIREMNIIGENQIYGAYGITCLADKSLIVTDKLDYKIKQFDSNGKLLREIGKKGRGPSKFSGPYVIAAGKKNIAVADFQSPRVQMFSFDLTYIDEFYAPAPIINLAYDKNDDLWIAMGVEDESESLVKVNKKGEVIAGIRLKNIRRDPFDNLFNFTILKDGTIIVVYACQNILEKWDIQGKFYCQKQIPGFPQKSGRIKLHDSNQQRNNRNLLVPNGMLFFKIASDTLNQVYMVGEDYSLKPLMDVFILNKDGDLTGLLELPRESNWIYIDALQNLWSIEGNRKRIVKYKILQ